MHPLIEVTPAAGGTFESGELRWDGLADLASDVQNTLLGRPDDLMEFGGLTLPDAVFDAIVSRGGPPQIFLKQFRSVSHGARAAGQQITDAGMTLLRIDGAPLKSRFDFNLHHLDSHKVEEQLGIKNQSTALAFEMHMDFMLEEGRVMWQAPVR